MRRRCCRPGDGRDNKIRKKVAVPLPLPDRLDVFVKRDGLGHRGVFARWLELKSIIKSSKGGGEYSTRNPIGDQ